MVFGPIPFVNELAIISTPFVIGWRMIKFRNYALDGIMSYRRALAYCIYTGFYASVAFAVAQVLYFQFLDHGHFAQLLSQSIATWEQTYRTMGVDTKELTDSLNLFTEAGPIAKAFTLMVQNMWLTFMVSFVIALFGTKKAPTLHRP